VKEGSENLLQAKNPRIPIASLVQSANDLHFCCRQDRTILENYGLDWSMVEQLPEKLSACAKAEAAWYIYKNYYKSDTLALKEEYRKGRKLRTDLAAELRNAFKIAGHTRKLPGFKKKWTRADIVQDLYDLAFAAKENDAIIKQKYIWELVTNAEQTARKLSKMTAQHTISRPTNSDELRKRNQIAHELSILILKIREIGRTAFKDDPERLQCYCNKYPA
jgi:hypothetical protein